MGKTRGFTLIELVMVIVLLAIVATISVQFVSLSTRGAIDVGARQQRALQGVVISEQISRELREAFPLSIRVSGNCLEWLPLVAGTSYVALPKAPSFDKISAAQLSNVPSTVGLRAVVYGYGTATSALYGNNNPGPISPEIATIDNSTSPATVSLSAAHRFAQPSPEKRLFFVGDPVSLCQSGNVLYRYSGYGRNASQPSPPSSGREVLAANLTGAASFSFTPATFRRAAVVQFRFTLRDPASGEATTLSQEVQIRNVP